MWFKKKAQISGYNPNTAVDGSDWRITSKYQSWSVSQTLPSAADANNYFYLPASGFYGSGYLGSVGASAYYWSSSASPAAGNLAYHLIFSGGYLAVSYYEGRHTGFRVGGFE